MSVLTFDWEPDPYLRACYIEEHQKQLACERFVKAHKADLCARCGKPLGALPWAGSMPGQIKHGYVCS